MCLPEHLHTIAWLGSVGHRKGTGGGECRLLLVQWSDEVADQLHEEGSDHRVKSSEQRRTGNIVGWPSLTLPSFLSFLLFTPL